jgi:aryl-alcohol dehydrogenase-like predicted oxidoreductase
VDEGLVESRKLGITGPVVSALGLGCMGMSQGYGEVDEREAVKTLDAALDAGLTLLDTAMSYDVAHQARIYDCLLGGKDNYAADRTPPRQRLRSGRT